MSVKIKAIKNLPFSVKFIHISKINIKRKMSVLKIHPNTNGDVNDNN